MCWQFDIMKKKGDFTMMKFLKWSLISFVTVAVLLYILITAHFLIEDLHCPYNEDDILFKKMNEIVEKYGEFDKIWEESVNVTKCTYLIDPGVRGESGEVFQPVHYVMTFHGDTCIKAERKRIGDMGVQPYRVSIPFTDEMIVVQ